MADSCTFCRIVAGEVAAARVFEDSHCLAFLDHRPVFAGHCLLVPKSHIATLQELPPDLANRLFANARLLSTAVEGGLGAEGSFLAVNNRVSQSVPHVHFHVIPRRKGDGLKGFFWPRRKYRDEAEMEATRAALEKAILRVQQQV